MTVDQAPVPGQHKISFTHFFRKTPNKEDGRIKE